MDHSIREVGSEDASTLATACLAEAKRRLGPDAPLSRVVQLATRIETACGRVRVSKQEVDEGMARLMERIEQAISAR